MNPARLGFLVLVPAVALVHGFGQYFARNMWFVALSESGGDYDVLKVAEVAATVGAVGWPLSSGCSAVGRPASCSACSRAPRGSS
jgi:hypothetical protein